MAEPPFPALLGPADRPPPRRPGSVRRTSTMQMSWPGGIGSPQRLDGRARDLLTRRDGTDEVLAQGAVTCSVNAERTVQDIATLPEASGIQQLVGARAGGNLRGALAAAVPRERDDGTPLYLLLDDLAGASLIAGFVMIMWADAMPEVAQRFRDAPKRRMEGICSGFRPGSSALDGDGNMSGAKHDVKVVPPLADPGDQRGWHELLDHPPMAMRRARRIDVWRDGAQVAINAMFRDSCWDPAGVEVAVHEYELVAHADGDGTLADVVALPRVLPFAECPGAAPNAGWVAGTPLRELRTAVLEQIRDTHCCTHLNDALRALAEVPVLVAALGDADA